jgi:hypothetical protein
VTAVDSNLLIYSHREDSPFHPAAKETIEELRHQATAWAIPWPCVHEFISIATHPKARATSRSCAILPPRRN